jgi:Zn-dependent peptidase ImmA (M78 family)
VTAVDAALAAEALIERRRIRRPHEIRVDMLAWAEGFIVRTGDTGRADARVARSGNRAVITVSELDWGTPRGRFSVAHEMAHPLLHPNADAIARIHGGGARSEEDRRFEHEANEFARHLIIPRVLAAVLCEAAPPDLSRVLALAEAFDASLSVAVRRYTELSTEPCAFAETKKGVVKWAKRSRTFRGEVVQGRPLPDGSLALDRTCGWAAGERQRLHRAAWGAGESGRQIVEECVPITATGTMLVWLWHA